MATMTITSEQTTAFIAREKLNVIQKLAVQSRRNPGISSPTPEQKDLLTRLEALLKKLDEEVTMSPEFLDKTNIDKALKLMFDDPDIHFPEEYANKAQALYEKWEGENWGAPVVKEEDVGVKRESEDEVSGDAQPAPKRRRTSTQARSLTATDDTAGQGYLRLPPENHPIWGENGIMHGLCIKKGPVQNSNAFDPRYEGERRNAKVFGHNGLEVGDWFPQQMVAMFRGAHGHSQAGIHGSKDEGAYSILVSGTYDELDKDEGDTLYYSAPGSKGNEDPRNAGKSKPGTLALHASLASGKPVRVLRTSSGKSLYRPSYGFRYDGLYRVVSLINGKNTKGGMFEQFKLVRLDGQNPIDKRRPNPREIDDYERIGEKFPKDRGGQ